jgi:hypothetical protein
MMIMLILFFFMKSVSGCAGTNVWFPFTGLPVSSTSTSAVL